MIGLIKSKGKYMDLPLQTQKIKYYLGVEPRFNPHTIK